MAQLGAKFSQHAKSLGTASAGLTLGMQKPTLTELPLDQIETDPNQPRRDLGDLTDLSASIVALGVIQPVIVTIVGYDRYRVLAGERRFSAAKAAGLSKIPAIVRSVEEHGRLELQLVENLHRKDLNPFEEAASYQRLLDEFRLTHEELGKRVGKTQVSVTETLKVLDLPERVAQEFQADPLLGERIRKSLLVEIARRPRKEQFVLWEEAKRGELTVRKVRASRALPLKQEGKSVSRMLFRYPIALLEQNARITIEFAASRPRLEDIVLALEEALTMERARIVG